MLVYVEYCNPQIQGLREAFYVFWQRLFCVARNAECGWQIGRFRL